MVVKQRPSASCRHFARHVQSPSKAPSTLRLAARIVRIARFTSTQRSPHTAAAVSFATSSTNSNTTARSTCVIYVARWLRAALDDERLRDHQFDVIVSVPLHSARQRERGFNQASLLAELLSAHTSIPSRPLLKRIRYTTTQTALDRSERMENLHNAFRLRKNADVRGLRVLLIDDVLTTGSTLSECARVLKRAGANSVHAATAARA
jgi:ComF family protein